MKRDLAYRCTLAILILASLAALAVAGPGCGASRKVVIGDAKNALDAATAAAAKWSEAQQNEIVDAGLKAGHDPAVIREQVQDWRKKYDEPLRHAAVAAYTSLYLAALDPSPAALAAALVEAKKLVAAVKGSLHPSSR